MQLQLLLLANSSLPLIQGEHVGSRNHSFPMGETLETGTGSNGFSKGLIVL